jgi:hypothetical protein
MSSEGTGMVGIEILLGIRANARNLNP